MSDEDIVILALNGLPSEYNTFRCVVRGREIVISLRDFRSQLLVVEQIVENLIPDTPSCLSTMHTNYRPTVSSSSFFQPSRNTHGYTSYDHGGYKSFSKVRAEVDSIIELFLIKHTIMPNIPQIQVFLVLIQPLHILLHLFLVFIFINYVTLQVTLLLRMDSKGMRKFSVIYMVNPITPYNIVSTMIPDPISLVLQANLLFILLLLYNLLSKQ